MTDRKNILGTITKIIFIGGAAILFILLAIWIIRGIPKLITSISNMGGSITETVRGNQEIDITVNNSEIHSGENFVVSWDYSPSTPGEYYVSYSCAESLTLDIQSSNGQKRIICNIPFKLGEDINSISLVPTITKNNIFIDDLIKITYRDSEENTEIASGQIEVTLKNTDGSGTTSNPFDASLAGSTVSSSPTDTTDSDVETNTPKDESTAQTTSPIYYTAPAGKSDLAITNIARTAGQSALSFTVYNYGGTSTGIWYFSYTDAENPTQTITSPAQPNLRPGQGLFIQVRFDGQRYESQVVTIKADSFDTVNESDESNNTASVSIFGDTNSNYNDYYYNYSSNDDADLVIDDMAVGRMSGSRFIEDDDIDEDDDAAVQFTVRNKGGESTGNWRFEITDTPFDNDDDYRSGRQSSLRPGEETTITVEFENPDEGTYTLRLEVDSDDDVDEENENNNRETQRLRVRN